ncbi:MAG TPA: translocation/assembly module TamB domain-containing protein [Paracoccaceae bacterium]|nr:translocation/assembly module TamB domain-containing protein [Paracoccaceae bacterium]
MRRLLALALCLLPFAATAQQDDRDRLTRFLEENLSSAGREVQVEGFRGALSSRAQMDRLSIADDRGVWIELTGVVLDWNRLAVLSGRIEINELSAREITVSRRPAPEQPSGLPAAEAQPFALPELPVSVAIARIAAERVTLGPDLLGQPVVGALEAALNLADGEGRARLNILRQDDGPEGRIALDASYANASGALVLSLEAVEGPGGVAATLLGLPGAPAARLAVTGAGPLRNFAADMALETDGVERLAGRVTLAEDGPGNLRFTADLGGNPAPLFLPEYAAFFGPDVGLVVEGTRAASGRVALRDLSVTARALTLQGSVEVAADGLPERFVLDARLGLPSGESVLLPLAGDAPTRVAGADAVLSYDAAQGDGWVLRAALSGLDRPDIAAETVTLAGSGRIARRAATGQPPVFGGTLDFDATGLAPADPGLDETLRRLGRQATGRAMLSVQAGDGKLRIGNLRLSAGGLSLTGRGTVAGLGSGFEVSGQAEAEVNDMTALAPLAGRPLAGAARLAANGSAELLGGGFDVVVRIDGQDLVLGQAEADSLLRGASSIDLSAARGPQGTDLRDLTVLAGGGRIDARGRATADGADLTARLDLPDLAVLGGDWGGGLRADLAWGALAAPERLTLTGQGRDLRMGRAEVDGLLRGASTLDIALTRAGGRIGIDRARITNPQADLAFAGHFDPGGSDLSVTARLASLAPLGPGYRGALDAQARLTGTPGAGRLEATASGRGLAVGQAEADRLLAGDSRLTLRLGFEGGRLRIDEVRLANPQVTASATGEAANGLRRLAFDGRLANLALVVPAFPGPLTLSGTAVEDGAGFGVDVRTQGPGGIDATVRGRIAADLGTADLAIAGRAQAALADAFIGNRAVSGDVGFDLRLAGRPSLAALSGTLSLTGGRFSDPDLPFSLGDLSARATLSGGRAQIDGQASASGGGRLSVSGGLGLAAPFPADLSVVVTALRLRDPQLFETVADGRLTLSGPLTGGARLAGRIDLGQTELSIPATGLAGAGDLPGLRHAGDTPPVRETRARAGLDGGAGTGGGGGRQGALALDLTVAAPNRIFLRGRGLDAELGGAVILRGTTANVIAEGAFDLIRGRLDILGKRLVLSRARLALQGDLVPSVDIEAATDSDGITTFVRIAGRADEPEVTFASAPELPQDEVLARLLFGRGLQNISAFQAAQLAAAVATLAGRGGDGIVARLRKGFGLDDLDIATDGQGGTTLRAGKYISENVYTEVEVSPDGQSRINLNLDIRPGVTVKGRVGTGGEAGIGLFLERDY